MLHRTNHGQKEAADTLCEWSEVAMQNPQPALHGTAAVLLHAGAAAMEVSFCLFSLEF